jgi:hypothetical protein
MILSSDCERSIKLEVAFNIRFIIREYLDDKYIKHNFIRLFETFLNEDDLFLKTETFISILLNLKRINDEVYVVNAVGKIANLIDGNSSPADFNHLVKVFDFMVEDYASIAKDGVTKQVYGILKSFLKV